MKGDQATWPCSGWTDGWTENLRVEQGHQLKGAFWADIGVKGCGAGTGGGACRTERWLQGGGDGGPKTAPPMTSATSLWGPQYPHLKGSLALAQVPQTLEHLC